MRGARVLAGLAAALVLLPPAPGEARRERVLDAFDDLAGWTATASPGVSLEMARDAGRSGSAMRLDFDFRGNRGFVIARKPIALTLPANYAFRFQIRGEAPPNTLELKLVDPSGENVWWSRLPELELSAEWRQITIRKGRFRFAWGPADGAIPGRVGAIEIAIASGAGGKGSVWIDDLVLEKREPDGEALLRARVTASTSIPGHDPPLAADGDPATSWRSGTVADVQWLLLDFARPHEYGGLVIDWDREDYATSYRVGVSDDGESWALAYASDGGNGGRDYVYLPDGESRYVRIDLVQSSRGQGYAIRSITVQPADTWVSLNELFAAVAADAPPGSYPKYLSRRQTYWTVAGVHGDDHEGLLNEEGMLETGERAFSLEPFVLADGALVTWHDVETAQSLERDYLPIPSVAWHREGLGLRVTAFASGAPGETTLYARYELENRGETRRDLTLFLAIRPFQVLPPWQDLNMVGGVTPVRTLHLDRRVVWVNEERAVVPLTPPDGFGAATFQQGLVDGFLRHGRLPLETRVSDPFAHAEGALEYRFGLEPGGRAEVHVAVPFAPHDEAAVERLLAAGPAGAEVEHARVASEWETLLGRVELGLPPAAARLARTLKTTLAYILINRDGPAIQPGSRTYARSWIRDGALTSTVLLMGGFTQEVRDFLTWFAAHQLPDGRIPCCVDRWGADPVPEHDSNGQFAFTVAEYYRYTRDVGFLYAMWPAMVRAIESIAALRATRTTDEFRRPETEAFYGLLPESISHEGYSAHPVHSYWDDFWALRGLDDAAAMAVVVGDDERAAGIATLRDEMRRDVHASIARTMARRGIDYLPASVELADFDPSSTAIAVFPGNELAHLPAGALARTFDRYWEDVQARRRGAWPGEAYTPYELRNVGLFVRLGDRARAAELIEALVADQRPPGWNAWQEIAWRDPAAPRFIGDMPHTWVGAGFVRSLRAMLAYEREEDGALVLAAGVPAEWLAENGGVSVKRLPTHYGVLTYTLRADGPGALRLRLSGDLAVPPGGIVVQPPLPGPLKTASVNGRGLASFAPDHVTLSQFPADLRLEY
jgi:hypothetical protein